MAGLLASLFVQVFSTRKLPVFTDLAIDQLGLGLRAHIIEGTIVADKVTKLSNFVDYLYSQGLVRYLDAVDRMFDHGGKLIVHDQLAVIKGDSGFDHS